MTTLRTIFFLTIGAFLFTGCATFGSVQRANTLGKDNFQVGLEPGSKGFVVSGEVADVLGSDIPLFWPDIAVSFRYGLSDRFDFGGRVGINIYDVHMKYQFTDPESTGPVLSLAPAMSLFPAISSGGGGVLGIVNLPLLIGIPVGDHQVVIGPRIVDYFVIGGGSGGGGIVNIVFAGASFAFAFQLTERFGIIPEVTAVYPVAGAIAADGASGAGLIGIDAMMLEIKLGFLIGHQ